SMSRISASGIDRFLARAFQVRLATLPWQSIIGSLWSYWRRGTPVGSGAAARRLDLRGCHRYGDRRRSAPAMGTDRPPAPGRWLLVDAAPPGPVLVPPGGDMGVDQGLAVLRRGRRGFGRDHPVPATGQPRGHRRSGQPPRGDQGLGPVAAGPLLPGD